MPCRFMCGKVQRSSCISLPTPRSSAAFLCGPARAVTPHRTKSKRRLTPARLFAYRIAALLAYDHRGAVAHVPFALHGPGSADDADARARRRRAGVLAPAPDPRRAVHRRSALRAQARLHDLAVGRRPGADDARALYGAHVVRGSGPYTGVRAVRGVHQAIVKDGISPGITPDGPRGPRFKLKPGAIFTAQISRKAVVPIAYAAKPAWMLRTWDKFVIPPPFARIVIAIGEPYYPAED